MTALRLRPDTHKPARRWRVALPLLLLSVLLAGCNLLPVAQATPTPLPPITPPTVRPTAPAQATTAADATPSAGSTSGQAPAPTPANVPRDAAGKGVTELNGSFTYTNDFIFVYYVEYNVALVDMYGFVTRDEEWKLPIESQVLGYLDIDRNKQEGRFNLNLPALPRGTLVDVDNDGQSDTGVQVFALTFSANLVGSPFSSGDDQDRGWPSYLASTVNDPENNNEVTGGKLVVWAPDEQQQFPTGFGPDGQLFTKDDPVGPIPPGFSVVDLDKQPFATSQNAGESMTLYEPKDAAIKDFSNLSFTDAFQKMFDQIKAEYAFNGIADKQPDWDKLYAELAPRVAEADRNRDASAFDQVMLDYVSAFRDGHVGLGGSNVEAAQLQSTTSGGYGFAIRELDDGRVIVSYVVQDGPADKAGITVGAEVQRFNDQPIGAAIKAVKPLGGPFSTDYTLHYQQQRYLLRAPVDTDAKVTFANPNQAPNTVTLTSVRERESFAVTSLMRGFDPNALPVEFRFLDSGAGYIKINSNYDDLNLLIRLFERALETFERNQVPGVITDLRQNSGGAPMGLASYFSDTAIPVGQDEYFSSKTGRFEPDGPPDTIEPSERQFRFDKLAILVSPACASACEYEAYGFSRLPGAIVVGQYPSAGVYAEVSRGQFRLPSGLALQVPTGRTRLPDGSILLEGKGVEPTLRVPITAETVLAQGDVILDAAEKAVSGQ